MNELETKLKEAFLPDGSCPSLGDPYRDRTEIAKLIFDEEGDVNPEAYDWIYQYVYYHPTVEIFSDAVKILYADDFGANTKGSYPAIYAWR